MIVSIAGAVLYFCRSSSSSMARVPVWVLPLVCAAGVAVAEYLTYIETHHVAAVCGPVGDCNAVQQSPYANLFGFLPVGALGLVGYIFILFAWFMGTYAKGRLAVLANLGVFGLAFAGLLFSLYLTFLEPFVIGATCVLCLASAILMTAIFWLSLRPGKTAFLELGLSPKTISGDD